MPIRFVETKVLFDLDKCSFKGVVEQKLDWARSMRGEEVKTIWGITLGSFAVMGDRGKEGGAGRGEGNNEVL